MEIKTTGNSYLIDNKRYDRVTSILDHFTEPGLVDWVMKVGVAKAKTRQKSAKRIGTRIHNLARKKFETGKYYITPKEPQDVRNCMNAYEEWYKIESPAIVDMEVTRYSDKYGFAGTRDIRLGKDTILDIKTSERIRPSYWLQLACYAHMAEFEVKNIAVLRLDKMVADYEYKSIPLDARLFNIFLSLYAYYRYATSYNKKKEEEVYERVNVAATEVEKRLGIFQPEIRDDWTQWHREV